jgi:hypothetical protein
VAFTSNLFRFEPTSFASVTALCVNMEEIFHDL